MSVFVGTASPIGIFKIDINTPAPAPAVAPEHPEPLQKNTAAFLKTLYPRIPKKTVIITEPKQKIIGGF